MASPRLTFSRKSLSEIQPLPKRTTYMDVETRGLILDVTPNGAMTFRIYRKVNGRPERITLGRLNLALPESREFPQGTDLMKVLLVKPELNVKMARRLAEAVNVHLDSGLNPAETKRKARGELTLGQMFERYMTDYAIPHGVRTAASIKATFQVYLGEMPDLPAKKHGVKRSKSPVGVNWEHRRLSSISADEVRRFHMAVGKVRAGSTANQLVDLLSVLYNKAREWGEFAGESPTSACTMFPEVKRKRFLQPQEMPAFWAALRDEPVEWFRDLVTLAVLTGARAANVMSMRWKDVNLHSGVWTIPDAESKNKETLSIVLVPESVAILERRLADAGSSEWVFSADSESGHVVAYAKRWRNLLRRAGIEQLRFHDLRRSLGSWQARNGASLVIIGKSLGHKSTQATQIYAQLDMDPVRDSVVRATTALIAAGDQPAGARVVPIKAKPAARAQRTVKQTAGGKK